MLKRIFPVLILTVFALSACSIFELQQASSSETTSAEPVVAVEPAVVESTTTLDLPAWMNYSLVNGRTGETFTLAQYVNAGTPVYVEPFATWCSNCRTQLGNVNRAMETLGDEAVFVVISVETGLTAEDMKTYAERNNFNMIFTVATPELLSELAQLFGRTVTNPPATPHFIIRRDGTTTNLITGFKSADEVVASLRS